jgi:hypothetical protein
MTPVQLANESYELLNALIQEAYQEKPTEDSIRSAFVYRHARNVLDIGTDVRLLYSIKRYTTAQIAIRSMIESMFCVAAAVKLPEFAAEKIIAEWETFAEKVSKIDKVEWSAELIKTKDLLLKMADDMRKECAVSSKNKWSVYDIARVANLQHHYATDYLTLSNHVHAASGALIFQEKCSGVGDSHKAAVTAMLLTAGHFAQHIQTKSSKDLLATATRLVLELSEEPMQLAFREIDNDTDKPWVCIT